MEIKTWKDLIPIKSVVFTDDETDFSKEALEEMMNLEKLQKQNEGDSEIFYGITVWALYKDGDYDVDGIASSFKALPESVPHCAREMRWDCCDAIKISVPYDKNNEEYDEILLVRKSKVM